MKRESTLPVQSEKPAAYAGRRERQAPAPGCDHRKRRTPMSCDLKQAAGGRSKARRATITKDRQLVRKILHKKSDVYDG